MARSGCRSARGCWSVLCASHSALGWPATSGSSRSTHRRGETLESDWRRGCWSWPHGGPPSPRAAEVRSRRWPSGSLPLVARSRSRGAGAMARRCGCPHPGSSVSSPRRRTRGLGSAVFVIAVALLYGSTMALSARDGVQPLEFNDEAYYSVLARTWPEQGLSRPTRHRVSTRSRVCPLQTWYHWGSCGSGRQSSRSSASRHLPPGISSYFRFCCSPPLADRRTGQANHGGDSAKRLLLRVPCLSVPRAGPSDPRPAARGALTSV